jgi:hypothetical protein
MYARVSQYRGRPDRVEEGIRHVNSNDISAMEGSRGAYLLVDRQSGEAMTITLWDSAEAAQRTAAAATTLRSAISEAFGDPQPPIVKTYEVAAHFPARGAGQPA